MGFVDPVHSHKIFWFCPGVVLEGWLGAKASGRYLWHSVNLVPALPVLHLWLSGWFCASAEAMPCVLSFLECKFLCSGDVFYDEYGG